jgi:hypothetical protein
VNQKPLIVRLIHIDLYVLAIIEQKSYNTPNNLQVGKRRMSWEDKFQTWAMPPSQAEQEKATNAERAIRRAITDDKTLSKMDIKIIQQGSYRANTNVRLDSDVDICVCLQEPFFCNYPPGKTREDFGNVANKMTYQEFKGLVETALVHEFGRRSVTRGNKAFDVHENTYRIDADVVAALAHRRYTYNNDGTYRYIIPTGVEFHPDAGGSVINWPEQTYTNGVAKNDVTGRRYKGIVRILKRLRNEMQEKKIVKANNIGSFLIESLVWNVPSASFGNPDLSDDVKYVLAHCIVNTKDDEKCREWREVNELKYLFRTSQPWTREQAYDFLIAAWNYVGFK